MPTSSLSNLDELRSRVRGPVWQPGDPDFDALHRPWNLAIEQQVSAIVEAADAQDISDLVAFAASIGVPVATQPSGHGATGRAAGAILLRTSRLNDVDITPSSRTARIGSGVRSGDLQRAAAAHGLTALPGSSPGVSVTGATLGGGLSWFGRAFGWMADNVIAFEAVVADGTRVHVSAESDAEMFWALRGGGGEVAIVTALTIQLHPAPHLFGGRQLWSAVHARQVAQTYRAMTLTAPDNLTLWLELLNFPGAEPMVAIDSTFLGDEHSARELLAATGALPAPIWDGRAAMSVADIGTITADPPDPSPGQSRAELLTGLDDAAFDALLDVPISPLLMAQVRHLGGAFARPSESPHGALLEPYAIYLFGVPSASVTAESIARKQADLAAVLPTSGRKPVVFLNPAEQLSDALPADSLERLRRLKLERDPKSIIRGNFGIHPAAAATPECCG